MNFYQRLTEKERSRFKVTGQVMLFTILTIGITMLGATTIAGLLTIFQIRQTTNLANSAKAIFAADTGIEWSLYDLACRQNDMDAKECIPQPTTLGNGATLDVTNTPTYTISVGSAGKSSRAFRFDR